MMSNTGTTLASPPQQQQQQQAPNVPRRQRPEDAAMHITVSHRFYFQRI